MNYTTQKQSSQHGRLSTGRKATGGRSRGLALILLLLAVFFVACEPPGGTTPAPGGLRVANPTFSPATGNLSTADTLIITSSTEGAVIYYSRDGNTPTSASPRGETPLLVDLSTFNAGTDYTIKAIAVKEFYTPSATTERRFTLGRGSVSTPVISPERREVTTADRLTISTETEGARIYYSTNGDTPTAESTLYNGPLSFGELPADPTIRAIAIKENFNPSAIAERAFAVSTGRADRPSFSPGAGAVTTLESLTIRTASPGAMIYYTSNGDDPGSPSSARTLYANPLSFASLGVGSYTIKAIALGTRYDPSEPHSAEFTVSLPQVAPPIFSPATGDLTSIDRLVISSRTEGASIRYTVNTAGTPDDSSSGGNSPQTVDFAALTVGQEYTIRAIAKKSGYADSELRTRVFRLSRPRVEPLTFSLPSGTIAPTDILTMGTATGDVTIYYTSNGDDPGSASSTRMEYINPLSFSTRALGSTFTIRAIATKTGYDSSAELRADFTIALDVDRDNDGLIEIDNLDMLTNIRYNLAGTSYKTGSDGTGSSAGAPRSRPANCIGRTTSTNLCGYELTQDLDFAIASHYASGMVRTEWRPGHSDPDSATNAGFPVLGSDGTSLTSIVKFSGIFEGNDHSINNLYIRNTLTGSEGRYLGLFEILAQSAEVRNIGLTNVNVYGADRDGVDQLGALAGVNEGTIRESSASGDHEGGSGNDYVGGLVGQNRGMIIASHASGNPGGGSEADNVGGLVGFNYFGTIIASHARGNPGGGSEADNVGGLVGTSIAGRIIASYAIGNPDGGSGSSDQVGGLLGRTSGSLVATFLFGMPSDSSVIASYAIGDPRGGSGSYDAVGGLIGKIDVYSETSVIASYASGNPNGGIGNSDVVGGLVGDLGFDARSSITASYASGNPDGGSGTNDKVSTLLGYALGIVTESYGFGSPVGGEVTTGIHNGSPKPSAVSEAADLGGNSIQAGTYAGTSWNSVSQDTSGVWNFGSESQNPALVYADYDARGRDHACSNYPMKIPGTTSNLVCGTSSASLVGGAGNQGR